MNNPTSAARMTSNWRIELTSSAFEPLDSSVDLADLTRIAPDLTFIAERHIEKSVATPKATKGISSGYMVVAEFWAVSRTAWGL